MTDRERSANDADGKATCRGCELARGGFRSNLEKLYDSARFYVYQDLTCPVEGLAIIASRRHFRGMDEMSEEEASEYAALLRRIRAAQRAELAIEHVYYFYNEDTAEHFHTWMIPRHEWMTPFGKSAELLVPALQHARDYRGDERDVGLVRVGLQRMRFWLANNAAVGSD